jgi:hypothetical protein
MILSVIILPRLNVNWKMCYHAIKKFYEQKCKLDYKMQTIQAGPSRFQHANEHTECKVIVLYTLEGSNCCKVKVLMY